VTFSFQSEALDKLLPAGFKKQREFFFLIREPNLMVIYKKLTVSSKDEYYLCFTHTFFSGVSSKSGKYLIPPLLEHYPVSIEVAQLRSQFQKYHLIGEFDCDLHHLKRELSPSNPPVFKPSFWSRFSIKTMFGKANSLISAGSPVEIALQEGLNFFEQFSPAFSYQVLQKYNNLNNSIIDEQLAACVKYMDLNKQS
jgi:hypothetical protein